MTNHWAYVEYTFYLKSRGLVVALRPPFDFKVKGGWLFAVHEMGPVLKHD